MCVVLSRATTFCESLGLLCSPRRPLDPSDCAFFGRLFFPSLLHLVSVSERDEDCPFGEGVLRVPVPRWTGIEVVLPTLEPEFTYRVHTCTPSFPVYFWGFVPGSPRDP